MREGPLSFVLDERKLCLRVQIGRNDFKIQLHREIGKIIGDIEVFDVDIKCCFEGIGKRFCLAFNRIRGPLIFAEKTG